MLAELVRRDGSSVHVEVGAPPPAELRLLDLPAAHPDTPSRGIGLVIGFPTRTYRLRPWSVGHPAVYDEVTEPGRAVIA